MGEPEWYWRCATLAKWDVGRTVDVVDDMAHRHLANKTGLMLQAQVWSVWYWAWRWEFKNLWLFFLLLFCCFVEPINSCVLYAWRHQSPIVLHLHKPCPTILLVHHTNMPTDFSMNGQRGHDNVDSTFSIHNVIYSTE